MDKYIKIQSLTELQAGASSNNMYSEKHFPGQSAYSASHPYSQSVVVVSSKLPV